MNDEIKNDPIAEALGVETNINLPAKIEKKPEANNQVQNDAEYVRTNLYNVIEKASNSLDELTKIASESQHPRAFEVLATLSKTIADTTDKLMKLHKDKKDVLKTEDDNNSDGEQNHNYQIANAVFFGTTADLLSQYKDQTKAIDVKVTNDG